MKKVIPIIQLAANFANIMRVLRYREGHIENDAEHSYQLAMTCWSTNHQYRLGLNDEKLLKYALVHDLVELYAGDTDAFGDKEKIASKKKNEAEALQKLKQNYPQFTEILVAIDEYDKKINQEAHLVNIMDKLVAEANIRHSMDDYYQRRKVTEETWRKRLFNKISYDSLEPKLQIIVDEAVQEASNTYKKTFFNNNKKK